LTAITPFAQLDQIFLLHIEQLPANLLGFLLGRKRDYDEIRHLSHLRTASEFNVKLINVRLNPDRRCMEYWASPSARPIPTPEPKPSRNPKPSQDPSPTSQLANPSPGRANRGRATLRRASRRRANLRRALRIPEVRRSDENG
jgi:hypothetical protein